MQTRANLDDAAHWRKRAEEARRIASQLDDPVARQTMLEIAAAYENLAAIVAARSVSK